MQLKEDQPAPIAPASPAGPATAKSHALAEYESRRCAICGAPYPPFGFGPPMTRDGVILWARFAHRDQVDPRHATQPPSGDEAASQPSLF